MSVLDPQYNFDRKEITLGGFRHNVIDCGSGEPVVLLHGFPSAAYDDWKYQIPTLLQEGYRVIAPDLLGHGDSERPLEVEHYTISKDADRIVELLGKLEIPKAKFIFHDRGAAAGWTVTLHRPELVERFVAMNIGHPNWVIQDQSLEQREMSWYMLYFQFRSSEDAVRRNDWQLFRSWLRFHKDADAWIERLSPPGALTAGLNWYRANRNPDAPPRPAQPVCTVPGLGLWAPGDAYLHPEYMWSTYKHTTAPWRVERIDGASHFMMVDQPEVVNGHIMKFFRLEL
jgi:pimeloyl-ACP methyl ester carboxylesterase